MSIRPRIPTLRRFRSRTFVVAALACVFGERAEARQAGGLRYEASPAAETAPTAPADASPIPGARIDFADRPTHGRDHIFCSTRAPVCIHASRPTQDTTALAATLAFEHAWEVLTGALELPPPDVDLETLAYDVFLTEASHPALFRSGSTVVTLLEARDVRSRMDRGRAFTLLDDRVRPGCALDAAAVRALARAIVARTAPATDETTALAQSSYLAGLAVPCSTALRADAAAAFQGRPDRALADPYADEAVHAPEDPRGDGRSRAATLYGEGASLAWARLDWGFARAPGGIVLASWALSPTMTAPGAGRWMHEPDTFDVLRASFAGRLSTGSNLGDLFLDVAVARAFMGVADDGAHAPETRALGEAALVPLDWDLPWPTRPRSLAARRPVAPSGASYLVVRHAGAPADARLRVEIVWEQHALFRWAIVKIDAHGRELGRIVIPTQERATAAQMTLVDLDGVDRVLLVGTNVGDPAYAFDPDEAVWEPHSFVVTVASE